MVITLLCLSNGCSTGTMFLTTLKHIYTYTYKYSFRYTHTHFIVIKNLVFYKYEMHNQTGGGDY